MQIYPEYMRSIAVLCEKLNEAMKDPNTAVRPGTIPVYDCKYGDELIGYLVDEVGGAYCFVDKDEYEKNWNKAKDGQVQEG